MHVAVMLLWSGPSPDPRSVQGNKQRSTRASYRSLNTGKEWVSVACLSLQVKVVKLSHIF